MKVKAPAGGLTIQDTSGAASESLNGLAVDNNTGFKLTYSGTVNYQSGPNVTLTIASGVWPLT